MSLGTDCKENGKGIFGLNPEEMAENSRKGGEAAGKRYGEAKDRIANGTATNDDLVRVANNAGVRNIVAATAASMAIFSKVREEKGILTMKTNAKKPLRVFECKKHPGHMYRTDRDCGYCTKNPKSLSKTCPCYRCVKKRNNLSPKYLKQRERRRRLNKQNELNKELKIENKAEEKKGDE